MSRPRILLADDHTLFLEGLRKILDEDFDVVDAVEDGRTLIEAAQRLEPDVIILDISMPLLNGLDAARHIKQHNPRCQIIFLTMHTDPTYATEAFQAGASGFLVKRSAATELPEAIRAVLKKQYYVTPVIAKDLLLPLGQSSVAAPPQGVTLTPRQREVLQLIAEGKSIKEMATILCISPKTVEFHKSRIMQQLDLHTTADLTKYAIAHHLIAE